MGRQFRKGKGKLGQRVDSHWKEIVRENAQWELFYKTQGIIPENEFEIFKKTCQENLPLTFRITGNKNHAKEISKLFINNHIPKLSNIDNAKPFAFPWYPNNLGFQIDLPKSEIKKNPNYSSTQQFLVIETEVGNISRQEAVSMIPPIVLDVKSNHKVLDMCAAPGSKTSQLVESLHSGNEQPTGFVMANDSDYRRSHMLVHQVKRFNSPNFIVVNHDAQLFPKIKLNNEWLKFDRILCDVPCTGDATMRKNVTVWKDWKIGNSLGLHPLQLNILLRGLQLLKKGGRLVYSTCSMNPLENEAVIATALKKFNGQVKIIDCKNLLPGLITHPGLTNWEVFGKDMKIKDKLDDSHGMLKSLFVPDDVENLGLENCMRVYPHDQNTGGFFITVLEKIDDVKENGKRVNEEEEEATKKQKVEVDATQPAPATEQPQTTEQPQQPPKELKHVKQNKTKLPIDANEEPFIFLPSDNSELVKCFEFYGISSNFDKSCTLVRNKTGTPLRTIYYVHPIIKSILIENEEKLKFVFSGIKLFVSQKNSNGEDALNWRIQNESLSVLKNSLPKTRQFEISLKLLKRLLEETFPNINTLKKDGLDPEFLKGIEEMSEGCCFINIKREREEDEDLFLVLWKGKWNFNLMVNKHETQELLYRLFGVEVEKVKPAKSVEGTPEVESTSEATPEVETTTEATPEVESVKE